MRSPFRTVAVEVGAYLTVRPDGNTVLPMTTISFKVTEDEARLIRLLARKEGVSVSDYLRRRARGSSAASQKPRRVRCPHTGAMIFAGLDEQPPLTTESVRALLADFP
jgi:hypothetical protein